MIIGQRQALLQHSTPRAFCTSEPPEEVQQDLLDISGLPPHAQELKKIGLADEAMQLQAPTLKRPVLMVHGLAQHADTWVNMKNFLTNNPNNVYGGTYTTKRESDFLYDLRDKPESNVFAIDLSDNLAAPKDVAHEVNRAIRAIANFTGAQKVDVITHSMGALTTREALNVGGDKMGSLIMIAPPNQGAYEANLATNAAWIRAYDHYPQEMMGAMNALRMAEEPWGGPANEWLYNLNAAWPEDRKRLEGEAAIITGTGMPTPDRAWTLVSPGDGMVAARRAQLHDTPMYVATVGDTPAGHPEFRDFQMFRYNHLQIVSEAEVYQQVGDILSRSPAPEPPPPPKEQEQFCFYSLEPSFRHWTVGYFKDPSADWKQLSLL